MDEDDEFLAAFGQYVDQLRPVQGLRSRQPEYRQIEERGAARDILTSAGFALEGLRSPAKDPPDCEAYVDGVWSGIEVTELIDPKTIELHYRDRSAPIYRREWNKADFLAKIGSIIADKDRAKLEDHTYLHYFLVIQTDEMYLTEDVLGEWLVGAEFSCRLITDAFIGLSHPSDPYPTFKIKIVRDN
ncbi:hypothetical protein [Methylobacterium sp. WL2]|uniref:hypothetical protein n=1 Tax=Methylobacterium sp. WL2 TaxID=2603902 RepID=UPI0011C95ADF|nr:hypothetical protein [Methylobacterium sp. WL2]TXN54058.1 hypothetical protein FV241_25660 [Methylobacterium sp. WL2]